MKKIFIYTTALFAILSCQKVIDVDLNESNEKVVLDAHYNANDSTVNVRATLTSSFFNSEASPEINDAAISVFDENGIETVVPSIGNGNYQLNNYIPQFNSTYTLTAVVDGTSFSAECALNNAVPLEDITYEFFPGIFGNEPGYVTFLNFYDPAGEVNFYEVILTRNGDVMDKLTEVITQDDALTDGNFVERPLFTSEFFELNDVIDMELRSIDSDVFDYINQASGAAGGGSSTAPGNPKSNWSNGALGYFNAYSSSTKSVVIL